MKRTGVALVVLLTVLFVGLKLAGIIAWEWGWVLSPLWIGAGLALIGWIVGMAVLAVIVTVMAVLGERKNRAIRQRRGVRR